MKHRYPLYPLVDLKFNENVVAFYMGTPFCNFMVRPWLFEDDKHRRWDSSEAYFMFQKVWFHNRVDHAKWILEHSDCPGMCKSIGRRIPNYDELGWSRKRYACMLKAVTLKFHQNPDLARLLLGTGDRVMVEASPVDPWWGVGMGTDHPDILKPEKWKGTNMLGCCLMEVRRLLRVTHHTDVRDRYHRVPQIGSREYELALNRWARKSIKLV